VKVSDSSVFSNTAGAGPAVGGGIFVDHVGGFVFLNNAVYSNTISGDFSLGAGLAVDTIDHLVIVGNRIVGNRALLGLPGIDSAPGVGGLMVQGPCTDAVIRQNEISGNHVAGAWGGLVVMCDRLTISDNLISNNTAGYSVGGLGIVDSSGVTVTNNVILGNHAGLSLEGGAAGAGVAVFYSHDVTLTNNTIAGNRLVDGGLGGGVYVLASECDFRHNTIAQNNGGDGSGIHIASDGPSSTVSLINTIMVSHTVGITVAAGSTATMEATLWGSREWANGTDWSGGGTILTGTVNVWGDPAFADPAAGDYHIGAGSAAIDAGVDAGVLMDMDGEFRPMGDGYDIGADEYTAGPTTLYLPLILR
jgi:hypothetical protein